MPESAEPAFPALSFIVPLYNTGDGLEPLLNAFRECQVEGGFELILVNDASPDGTGERALAAIRDVAYPVVLVEMARNFGEHAAVLEGLRHARGRHVINLDDDLQNPISEALKLHQHLLVHNCEVVYSRYEEKKHHWFRNFGSWLTNAMATFLIGKPADLYLSSFRGMTRPLVERIIGYTGPYPYLDGLILGSTDRIDSITVDHHPRADGRSGYTIRKLVRLWMNMFFNFSVMPLRVSGILGAATCLTGLVLILAVLIEHFVFGIAVPGWASIMGSIAIFSGTQLVMLGLIGEYIGRTYLTVSGKPQCVVRSISRHLPPP